jgi:NAD(P)H-hydrate epimerase
MRKTVAKIPALPRRVKTAHKGACGRVYVVGGAPGMLGAPCLAAQAALRGGAGLVCAVVPKGLWQAAAIKLNEALTLGLPQAPAGGFAPRALPFLLKTVENADAVVLGPGLSARFETARFAREAVKKIKASLVLDADGLNAFTQTDRVSFRRAAPLIVTPHPGEAARLLHCSAPEIQKNRENAVQLLWEFFGGRNAPVVAVLKGSGTLVFDGHRTHVNRTGNPGMASGGTGDVLAGLIGALLGQKMTPFDAAVLGVWLHGRAGDLAAARLGVWSLIAGDLLADLPRAMKERARQKQAKTAPQTVPANLAASFDVERKNAHVGKQFRANGDPFR